MKTQYKHIHFVSLISPNIWICRNNKTNEDLGAIKYYSPWKRHVFEGQDGCVFDINCLNDIIDFIKQLK